MESKQIFKADPKLKLMDQVRQVLRYHHYAYQTEKTYCDWIVRYIRFHEAKKHPILSDKPARCFASAITIVEIKRSCRKIPASEY